MYDFVIDDTYTISAKTILDLRLSYLRFDFVIDDTYTVSAKTILDLRSQLFAIRSTPRSAKGRFQLGNLACLLSPWLARLSLPAYLPA